MSAMVDKRVQATIVIDGNQYVFISEPLDRLWADIILQEFIRGGPFKVVKAKLIPVGPTP